MEVLISVGILSIGLLGVASLIPLGTIALRETESSDRVGACGRAALREVKVRNMLDYNSWLTPTGTTVPDTAVPGIVALDPLGYNYNTTTSSTFIISKYLADDSTAFAIPRYTFRQTASTTPVTDTWAESIFLWQDELLFDMPKERTLVPAGAGDRPMVVTDTGLATGTPLRNGNFTWFFTVTPQYINGALTGQYTVSVVVCEKRILTADGERFIGNATCDSVIGYGGIGCHVPGNVIAPVNKPPLKNDEWVLLLGQESYTDTNNNGCYDNGESYVDTNGNGVHDIPTCAGWYRVVHAGHGGTDTRINLVGPDWYGGNDANGCAIIVVGGVKGVYTTTVELDSNNLIWTR